MTDEAIQSYLAGLVSEAQRARAAWDKDRDGLRDFWGCDAEEAGVIQVGADMVTLLDTLTDDQRRDVLWIIQKKYCVHCGLKIEAPAGECHCTNDE